MKTYFIHADNKQDGPFTIEELATKNVNRDTMVWFTGAPHWMPANQVEELQKIFAHIPPPLPSTVNERLPTTALEDYSTIPPYDQPASTKSNKAPILIIVGLLIALAIGGVVYYNQQQEHQQEQQVLQQQLQDQGDRISQQETLEANRRAEERRIKAAQNARERKEKIQALKMELDEAVTALRAEKEKLAQIRQFRVLRTREEKENQIRVC